MRVVSVQCPNCGARLQVEASHSHSTCEYCGTTSRIQQRTRVFEIPIRLPPPPAGQPAMPVARQVHSKAWYLMLLLPVIIVLFTAGLGYFIYNKVRSQIDSSFSSTMGSLDSTMGGLMSSMGTKSPTTGERFGWQGMGPALLVDVNGDNTPDPVGRLRYVGDRDAITLGAFDGTSGEQLWESEPVGTYSQTYRRPLVLAQDTLLMGSDLGTLTALSVKDGKSLWQAELGERCERVCATDDNGQVLVVTADRRRHRLSLASGELSSAPKGAPKGKDCQELPSDKEGAGAVERIEARRWRKRVKAKGMKVAYGLRQAGRSNIAVFGRRHPGTRIPMVGGYIDKSLAWHAELPAGNPMEAEDDLPVLATVHDNAIVAAYEMREGTLRLTHLALDSGERRWDVAVPKAHTSTGVYRGIACSDERIYVSSWGRLDVFDMKSGEHLYHLGR